MNDVMFHVARRGEGKTRWLLDKAHELKEYPVKLYCQTSQEYSLFCEKYFSLYKEICPVEYLNSHEDVLPSDIVLIDDLITLSSSLVNIRHIKNNCYRMYVTVEGETSNA